MLMYFATTCFRRLNLLLLYRLSRCTPIMGKGSLSTHHACHHHLLHFHERVRHHVFTVTRVLVRAICARTVISKLAKYIGVDKHAFITRFALGEKATLVTRVVKLALLCRFVAVREVPTPHSLFALTTIAGSRILLRNTC